MNARLLRLRLTAVAVLVFAPGKGAAGQVGGPAGAGAARGSDFDPRPAPLHPAAGRGPAEAPPPPDAAALLAAFSRAYVDAGSPRVAILYNRTFANKIASWTMDARAALHLPAAVAAREGFAAESLQWSFEESFAKPFLATGVRLVDASLVVQAAKRELVGPQDRAARVNATEINTNVEALRQHADWLVEVLMLPDPQSASGYLFRATLKRLTDGRILGSSRSTAAELRMPPPRTKIVYDDTGYRIVAEESPKPTLDDYVQGFAVRLLNEVAPALAASARP